MVSSFSASVCNVHLVGKASDLLWSPVQAELGDVVFVELPNVGATVTKGETFGVVESVKAASDVYSPVSGEVVEKNDALTDEPSLARSVFHPALLFLAQCNACQKKSFLCAERSQRSVRFWSCNH
jgi:hypothetical protein